MTIYAALRLTALTVLSYHHSSYIFHSGRAGMLS